MKLRKMIITVLAAAVIASLTACGDAASTDATTEAVTTEAATEAASQETEVETEAPETNEESADADAAQTEETDTAEDAEAAESEDSGTPSGDGLVGEEDLLKGWAWLQSKGFSVYKLTYEDVAEYFGVDGEVTSDGYVENIKRNKRDYKWISKDDSSHYIFVNFEEKDAEAAPGVYNLTLISANGFSGPDAVEKYKDEVQ